MQRSEDSLECPARLAWIGDYAKDDDFGVGFKAERSIATDVKVPVVSSVWGRNFGGYVASQIKGLNRCLGRYYMKIHVNNLQTKKEVLKWYLEMNEGGTPHSKEELDRIRKMLRDS